MSISSRFKLRLKTVLLYEGGYVDHPNDNGGATNKGVIQSSYDAYRLSKGLKIRHVINVEDDELEEIYHTYWNHAQCENLPIPLDLLVFDFAINSGVGRAVKELQKVLGVDPDGVFGRNTSNALVKMMSAKGVEELCREYLKQRESFYMRIVDKNPSQSVFLNGWLNRVRKLYLEAGLEKNQNPNLRRKPISL